MIQPAGHGNSREEYAEFHVRRFRDLKTLLARHLPSALGRTLDIGSGGDAMGVSEWLRDEYGADPHVVDFESAVELGRQKGLTAHACDVDRDPLPFEDASLDLVIFASIIEHLYNPHLALEEIARVVKPGGLLLLEAPNAVAFGRRIRTLLGRSPFQQFNDYNARQGKAYMKLCSVFYTAEEAERLLAGTYKILERSYTMHAPRQSWAKAGVRKAVARVIPNAADAFAIVARRNGAEATSE